MWRRVGEIWDLPFLSLSEKSPKPPKTLQMSLKMKLPVCLDATQAHVAKEIQLN